MNIIRFCKNWTLPIAMLSGVVLYFVYVNVPWFLTTREVVGQLVDVIQPVLILQCCFLPSVRLILVSCVLPLAFMAVAYSGRELCFVGYVACFAPRFSGTYYNGRRNVVPDLSYGNGCGGSDP